MAPEGTRWYLSLPADDPRFAELRAVLSAVQTRGRSSPAPRMLAEWALLGFLLSSGKLALSDGAAAPALPTDLPDLRKLTEVQALTQAVAAAASEFDFG